MARDKLITIRIEREKREAFNNLAKSQNSDTASLLYDFISQCLDGRIDISLVTGKGNRLDNQIDDNRIDKLETATQRLDERLGIITKKLNDWIEAIDDRITDSDQGLSEKIISLEHRLNALSIQLDSQRDSQQLDSIDTDSQQIDDMEPLLKREREASIASPIPNEEPSPFSPSPSLPPDKLGEGGNANTPEVSPSPPVEPAIGTLPTVETVEPISSIELDKGAIGPVGMNAADAAKYLKTKKVKVSYASLHRWRDGVSIPNTSPQGRDARKHLTLRGNLYYPSTD